MCVCVFVSVGIFVAWVRNELVHYFFRGYETRNTRLWNLPRPFRFPGAADQSVALGGRVAGVTLGEARIVQWNYCDTRGSAPSTMIFVSVTVPLNLVLFYDYVHNPFFYTCYQLFDKKLKNNNKISAHPRTVIWLPVMANMCVQPLWMVFILQPSNRAGSSLCGVGMGLGDLGCASWLHLLQPHM